MDSQSLAPLQVSLDSKASVTSFSRRTQKIAKIFFLHRYDCSGKKASTIVSIIVSKHHDEENIWKALEKVRTLYTKVEANFNPIKLFPFVYINLTCPQLGMWQKLPSSLTWKISFQSYNTFYLSLFDFP